jgi:hypothetical protein
MKTPKQQIDFIKESEKDLSFYSTANAFISLIEKRVEQKTMKIFVKLTTGSLGSRSLYNNIYSLCMEGFSEKQIKSLI